LAVYGIVSMIHGHTKIKFWNSGKTTTSGIRTVVRPSRSLVATHRTYYPFSPFDQTQNVETYFTPQHFCESSLSTDIPKFFLFQVKGFPDTYRMLKPDHPPLHKRAFPRLTQRLVRDARVSLVSEYPCCAFPYVCHTI